MRKCKYRNCQNEVTGRLNKKFCCIKCKRNELEFNKLLNVLIYGISYYKFKLEAIKEKKNLYNVIRKDNQEVIKNTYVRVSGNNYTIIINE